MISQLPRTWLLLLVLTASALLIGHVEGAARLRIWEAGLLLALAAFKARLVLRHFLELSPGSAWFGALYGSIIMLTALILGLAMLA